MKVEKAKDFDKGKNNLIWFALIVSILIAIMYLFFYSAQAQGYKYIYAYNQEKFEKAYGYYHKDTLDDQFGKDELVSFLTKQKQIDGPIKADRSNINLMLKDVFKRPKQVRMPIQYKGKTQNSQKRQAVLTMLQDPETKKWHVKFPYPLQTIHVFAPTGSDIYIGRERVAEKQATNKVEINKLLPGRHQVTIRYHEDIYPPFTKEITLPMERRVDSPYPTYNIAVFAPYNTWVTLGNISKYNAGPSVLFENMLPGQYHVSIQMKDRSVEIFSQTLEIDKEYTSIHLEKIGGNQAVKEDLEKFLNVFNLEYEKGIERGDTKFLHMFATEKINQDLVTDFQMWYIDNKDIKDAKSAMEIRDIYVLSGNELKASILEEVYLTNEDKEYKIVIEWNYKLLKNTKWKIAQRDIMQSMVAYKNEEGKWVSY